MSLPITTNFFQKKAPLESSVETAHEYITENRTDFAKYTFQSIKSNPKFSIVENHFTQSVALSVFNTMTCLYASTMFSYTPLGYRIGDINYKNKFIDVDIQNYDKKMFEGNSFNLKANLIDSINGKYILLNKCPGTRSINEISINDIVSGDKGYYELSPNQIQNVINDYIPPLKGAIQKYIYPYKCFTMLNAYSPVTYYTHPKKQQNLSGSKDNIRDFFVDFYGNYDTEYRFEKINDYITDLTNLHPVKYDYWLVSKYFDIEPLKAPGIRQKKYYFITELIEIIYTEGDIKYKRFKVNDTPILKPTSKQDTQNVVNSLTFEDFCIGNNYKIIGQQKEDINTFISEMITLLNLKRSALEFFHIHVGYNCIEELIILTIHGKYEITGELNHTIIDNISSSQSIPTYIKADRSTRIKFNNVLTDSCQVSILAQKPSDISQSQWEDHNTYIIIDKFGVVTVLKHHVQNSIDSNLLGISNFSLNILANQDDDILYTPEVIPNSIYVPPSAGGRKKKSIIKSKYNKKSRKITH